MSPTPARLRWTALVREQAASGETIRDFTERRGVNHSSFNWWRGRLRREAREAAAAAASASPFTELTIASSRPQPVDPQLVLLLDAVGARIVVDARTDLALLRQVVEALC